MDFSDLAPGSTQPVAEVTREQLVEPFSAATCAALGAMAGSEVSMLASYRTRSYAPLGDIRALVELECAGVASLVLSFPKQTARALAESMLAEAAVELDESLIRDCVGEIANVIAGQAKALLAGTPYQFSFALPRLLGETDDLLPQIKLACLVLVFGSQQGEFALQLLLNVADVAS